MSIYTGRKYREESRVPLDLRSPKSENKISSFWNYINSEKIIVNPNYIFIETFYRSAGSRVFRIPRLYHSYKMKLLNSIIPGSLVCILLCSKTFVGLKPYPKYRSFFGHCVWKRKNTKHPTILIRFFLLGQQFLIRANVFAPNLLSLMTYTPKHMIKKKYPSYIFKVKSSRYQIFLSKKKKQ